MKATKIQIQLLDSTPRMLDDHSCPRGWGDIYIYVMSRSLAVEEVDIGLHRGYAGSRNFINQVLF